MFRWQKKNHEKAPQYFPLVDKAEETIEGVSVESLMEEFGSPLFVVSQRIFEKKYNALFSHFKDYYPNFKVGYSFKTNYTAGICKIFKELGVLAEVTSGFEYFLAKKIGYGGRGIIFNGPFKKDEELLNAVQDGCFLNIDNYHELMRLNGLLESRSLNAKIGIRLSLPHGRNDSKPWDRFGFGISNGEAREILFYIQKHMPKIKVCGVETHLGTNITDPEIYRSAAKDIAEFVLWAQNIIANPIEYIDIGGGFAVYGNELKNTDIKKVPNIQNYLEAITTPIKEKLKPLPLLIIEPGRFLVSEGVVLLSRVISEKQKAGFVTADASISFLREASYLNLKIEALKNDEKLFPTTVFGFTCTQSDVLGKAPLPLLNENDVLIFYAVGAYSISRSSQWVRPRPAIIKISDRGGIKLLKRKETNEDFIALDEL